MQQRPTHHTAATIARTGPVRLLGADARLASNDEHATPSQRYVAKHADAPAHPLYPSGTTGLQPLPMHVAQKRQAQRELARCIRSRPADRAAAFRALNFVAKCRTAALRLHFMARGQA